MLACGDVSSALIALNKVCDRNHKNYVKYRAILASYRQIEISRICPDNCFRAGLNPRLQRTVCQNQLIRAAATEYMWPGIPRLVERRIFGGVYLQFVNTNRYDDFVAECWSFK